MADELDKTQDDIVVDDHLVKPIPYPRLEILAGPEEGLAYPLNEGEQVLGRVKGKGVIHLDDTSISREHAKLIVKGSTITVEDLGSRNGTFVNGQKIGEINKQVLTHLDQLKVGIYLLRLATKPITKEERATASKRGEVPTFVATSPSENGGEEKEEKTETEGLENEEDKQDDQKKGLVGPPAKLSTEPLGMRLKILFVVICLVSGLGGLAYFWHSHSVQIPKPKTQSPKDSQAPSGDAEVETQKPEVKSEKLPVDVQKPEVKEQKEEVADEGPRTFHAFLDIQSQPTTARIFFGEQFLGSTPLKAPVALTPDKEYTLTAEFDLKDVHDRYQQKQTFKADVRKEVFSFNFDAEIGIIKILRLPRSVDFYLEGYYAYDKYKAHPVRLEDIVYGKPIYVPFGQYILELREKVRVGDSETFVNEIRYHREFQIEAQRRLVELAINDRDLQFFPAQIQSVPSGADVYLDGEKIGVTPFSGELPLGEHQLKFSREGFFDSEVPLEMRTNTPYETKVLLKTSKVGELINQAKELRRTGQYQEAIGALVDALKLTASEREKAEAHLFLGDAYYQLGNFDQAIIYFEEAKSHLDFYYPSLLGLARTYYATGNHQRSLTLLVEVMLNVKAGDPLQSEARSLFQQLSPIKSVIYVSSEPQGATVIINSREVAQKTPVILSDLALGGYRIEITKRGYQPYQVRKSLKLGEFVPIFVTLKQEKI